ncbi:MAG: hypothetical protein ACQESR_26495 [Planctomycetota bacterium]
MDAEVTAKVELPFLLGSTLTEKQARQIAEMDEEASLGAPLWLAKSWRKRSRPRRGEFPRYTGHAVGHKAAGQKAQRSPEACFLAARKKPASVL